MEGGGSAGASKWPAYPSIPAARLQSRDSRNGCWESRGPQKKIMRKKVLARCGNRFATCLSTHRPLACRSRRLARYSLPAFRSRSMAPDSSRESSAWDHLAASSFTAACSSSPKPVLRRNVPVALAPREVPPLAVAEDDLLVAPVVLDGHALGHGPHGHAGWAQQRQARRRGGAWVIIQGKATTGRHRSGDAARGHKDGAQQNRPSNFQWVSHEPRE